MQQFVNGTELANLAELFFQNPLHILAAQRADAIRGRWPRIDSCFELFDLVSSEHGIGTTPRLVLQSIHATLIVATDPMLNLSLREVNPPPDFQTRVSFHRERDQPQSLGKLGVLLGSR